MAAVAATGNGDRKVSSIQELLHNERKVVGDQILIGLHDAAEKGLTETIEKIYDRTMDLEIDIRDRFERTPLHWAAESGHTHTCKVLIELGADPFAKEGMGRGAIHLAARSGHLDTVKGLVEQVEADNDKDEALRLINDEDHQGITPLFLARQKGDEDGMKVFEFLMNNGARYDVNKWPEPMELPPNRVSADE